MTAPTPDSPPTAPLTAAQIADEWLRLAREMPTGAVTVERRDRLDTEQGWIYETVLCVAGYPFAKFVDATETAYHASITPQRMIAFMEHHAALRDRLARAEVTIYDLRAHIAEQEPLFECRGQTIEEQRIALARAEARAEAREVQVKRLRMAVQFELNSLPTMREETRAAGLASVADQIERNREGLERIVQSVEALDDIAAAPPPTSEG